MFSPTFQGKGKQEGKGNHFESTRSVDFVLVFRGYRNLYMECLNQSDSISIGL